MKYSKNKLWLGLILILASTPAFAVDNRPVTREEFKELVRIFKRVTEKVSDVEKKVNKTGGGATSDTIDLSSLDTNPAGTPPIATGGQKMGTHGGNLAMPTFKTFFDLVLSNRPGTPSPMTFDNYHYYLFFEILPTPDIQFSFEVSTSPKYFELDYQLTNKIQLRLGRIWIPFDDMAPHNIFGGRVNVSRLAIGNEQFLPDLWTDLGVGMKIQFLDTTKLSLVGHAYVVNGFGDGGTDPVTGVQGSNYPLFKAIPVTDNNRDKAIGGRLQATIANMFGVGASIYSGRWNPETDPVSRRLTVTGFDGQIRVAAAEIRTGIAQMNVNLADTSFTRGGAYGEVGYRFGRNRTWKIMGRAGSVQLDNRVIAVTDQQLVGATLLYKPGLIEWSAEHSRDLKVVDGKNNYTYTALRAIMAF